MTTLSFALALALSASGPLSLYVRDGARLRFEIAVDPVSARHGIATKDIALQAEEDLGKCGFRVDPGAAGTVAVIVRGFEGRDGFAATVVVRARHHSVVNGSILNVDLYEDEKVVPGPAGEEAAKVKRISRTSSRFSVGPRRASPRR